MKIGCDIDDDSTLFHGILSGESRQQKGTNSVNHHNSFECIWGQLIKRTEEVSSSTVDKDIDIPMFLDNVLHS